MDLKFGRTLRCVSLIGITSLALAFPNSKQDTSRVVSTVMPSVFHLEAKIARGKAIGSGVVLRGDGLALTAAHVVDKSTSLEATFADGKRFPVEIVMKDSAKDYAVLKIRGSGFRPASIGRAKSLDLGADLIVIGSPKGLKFSVSKGIVSALRDNHIQTDAAINPGNSGGPVFSMDGKLVAIVNFGLKSTEGLKFCLMIEAVDGRAISGSGSSNSGSTSSGSNSGSSSSTATPDSGRWFVIATKERKEQKMVEVSGSMADNIEWMSRYRGYSIETVGKGAKGWVFVLTEGSDYTDQDYTISSTFPRDWVKKNWESKKAITSVARSKGKWIVVMSKTKRFVQQAYRVAATFDKDYVKGMGEKGFVLTDVDSDKDYVLHVVSRFGDQRLQTSTYVSASAPTKEIRDSWDNGFAVLSVGYLEKDKKWVVGMVKGLKMGEQAFWEGPYMPADWIKERWEGGFSITGIR